MIRSSRKKPSRLWLLCCVWLLAACCYPVWAAEGQEAMPAQQDGADFTYPFPAYYKDAGVFLRALLQKQATPALDTHVSGITLPHHLLAADLMAEGLLRLRNQRYERIILLSPDHYKRSRTAFSVPVRDFRTCLGPVSLDRKGVEALLLNPQVSASNLFSHEHGVQSLLPFLAQLFPHTPVLPVALHIGSKQEDWDSLAESLRPLLTDATLILQSTDFSHYLPWAEAIIKDQETLGVIASGNEQSIAGLHQPFHLDSRAAQYVQMKLQSEQYGASVSIMANHNACEYLPAGDPLPQLTTSYIVQLYAREPVPFPVSLPRYVLAGDFFTGRYLRKYLEQPKVRAKLVERIQDWTRGAPLLVNFEGALMETCPEDVSASQKVNTAPLLCMPEVLTLDLLRELNVVAVSFANNHSMDYGPEAYAHTLAALKGAGIAVVQPGQVHSFPEWDAVAFTDVENNSKPHAYRLNEQDFAFLESRENAKPLMAFVHWGREFRPEPDGRQRSLAARMQGLGIRLIAGAHPHRHGKLEAGDKGFIAWSMGNFVFDQTRNQADGSILELVFFPQGTFMVRQIPVGNLYAWLRGQ